MDRYEKISEQLDRVIVRGRKKNLSPAEARENVLRAMTRFMATQNKYEREHKLTS